MAADEVKLALELVGGEPEVVAVALGNPVSAGLRVEKRVSDKHPDVLLGAEDTDFVGVFGQPLSTDGGGAVGGGVIGDDKLEGEVGLLGDDGLDGAADGRFGVVGAHEDGDERGLAEARGVGDLREGDIRGNPACDEVGRDGGVTQHLLQTFGQSHLISFCQTQFNDTLERVILSKSQIRG